MKIPDIWPPPPPPPPPLPPFPDDTECLPKRKEEGKRETGMNFCACHRGAWQKYKITLPRLNFYLCGIHGSNL